MNAVGRLLGDRLDLHPAVLTRHDDGPARRAIDHDAKVELSRNRQALLDQQPRDLAPFRARLMRDERHAVNLIRQLVRLAWVRGELDAAALPSPARVNLCFHDDGATAEPFGYSLRVGWVHHRLACGTGTPYFARMCLA